MTAEHENKGTTTNQTPEKGGGGLAILAFLVAVGAGGAAGYLWYQWNEEKKVQHSAAADLDARLQTAVTAWEEDKQARLSTSAELDSRLEKALQTVADKQGADLQTLKQRVDEQQDSAQALKGDALANKGGIETLQNEAQILKSEIQSLQGDIQTLNGAIELQKGGIEIQKTDARTLQGDVRNLQNDVQALQGDIQVAKVGLDAQKDDSLARQAAMQKLQDEARGLDGKIQSLLGELQLVNNNLQTEKATGQERQDQIQRLQNEIRSLESGSQTLRGDIQLLQADLEQQQGDANTRLISIQALQDETQALKGGIVTLQDNLTGFADEQQGSTTGINSRLDNLQLGLRGLLNTLEAVKAVAARGGDVNAFALSEVEYLLRMADHKLTLARDVGAALQALEVARQRLVVVDESAFSTVERMIDENIAALRAVDMPDISGMIGKVMELERLVDSMPLRIDVQMDSLKEKVAPPIVKGEEAAEEVSWVDHLTTEAWGELKDIVVIRNERTSGPPLIAVEEEYFLVQNLHLEMEAVRLALIRGDAASYQGSIDKVFSWVETYFDADKAPVPQFLAELTALQNVPLNPYIPDLSGMLHAFQDVMKRREPIRSVAAPALVEDVEAPVAEDSAAGEQAASEEKAQ